MKYLIKFIIKTKHIYFINAIQNVLKNKFIHELNIIESFYCEKKYYYYLVNSDINDYLKFYNYIETLINEYEKCIKNIYPEFLDDWTVLFTIY